VKEDSGSVGQRDSTMPMPGQFLGRIRKNDARRSGSKIEVITLRKAVITCPGTHLHDPRENVRTSKNNRTPEPSSIGNARRIDEIASNQADPW
jgi:hypothetical protein